MLSAFLDGGCWALLVGPDTSTALEIRRGVGEQSTGSCAINAELTTNVRQLRMAEVRDDTTMIKTIGLTGLAAALLVLGACGDDTDNDTSGPGAGGSGNTMTSSSGGGNTGGSGGSARNDCTPKDGCEAPEPAHMGATGVMVDGIQVHYIDQDGNNAEGVQTTVCGTNICSTPATSDAGGMVTVDSTSITDGFDDPRFNAGHDGMLFAKLSGLIPTTPSHDFGTVRVVRLADFADGVAINPGETAAQGGVSITLAAEAEIQHSCVDYPEENQRVFRGAVVDVTGWDDAEKPQIDDSLGIEALVVAMPLGSHICPGVEMTFDNVNGYAAESEVDIYINGAKTFKHYAPYGQWAKVSEGVVSADGMTITTKENMNIELLGTYGIVPK